MARLLGSHAIQAKLTVGPAHDESEREADRVADEVMRMPEPMAAVSVQRAPPTIQRLCHECEEEKEEELKRSPIASQRMCTECEEEVQRESALVQRKCSECEELHRQHATVRSEAPSADPSAPPIVSAVLRSPGASMDHPIRTFMEDRFGTDFSSVRIHTDATAAESARAVNARAYTVGSNVAFGAGQYAPDSTVGRRLLAHELTHVIQQGSASTARGVLSLQRTATAAEPGETGTDLGPVAAASLGSLLPSLPPPCKPATSLLMAKALHAFVSGSFIPFARGMFGPQTTSLWEEYLDTSLGIPRPARAFAGSGEIVRGFTKHHKSAESEQEIVDASVAALRGPASSLLPRSGTTAVVLVTSLVPSATLLTRINSGTDPMGLDYDSPATTIPGNIAGGIGSGGPPGGPTSKDTRDVTGSMQLTVDSAGTTLTVVPSLTFLVHDTVDFCPGALGGRLAQVETVPMSILEATGARFGPVFAADVPFDVNYPGPGVSKSVPLPPTPPTPPTPPPTPPTPPPPPAPTPPLPSPPGTIRIHFNFDRPRTSGSSVGDSLDSKGSAALTTLTDKLSKDATAKVELVGRASPEGGANYNMELGARRALMIAQALQDSGIPSSQMGATPSGALAPGCTRIGVGLFSCGEIGATGAADREVLAIVFTSTPTPPTPPGPVPPTPPGPVPPTPPGPVPPAPPGPTPPTPPPPAPSGAATLRSVRFFTDQHVMKDNRADWENTGTLFPKPDWEATTPAGRSAPISHERNARIGVELTYDVASGAPGTPFTLIGRSAQGFLSFRGSGTLNIGSGQTAILMSDRPTPDAITESLNRAINWSIEFGSARQALGSTLGLDVFVTMAFPRRPDEVTYKRMAKAVELTGSVHTLEPHKLVHGIMLNFGAYNLDVQYANAWNMADNIRLGAQCIDIVRFVMGLIETVGCPGLAEAKLIYAEPTAPALAIESNYIGGHSLHDYPPHPIHPTWRAGLIDANACPNNFEAALRFTHGDTRYYPGGVSLVDRGGRQIIFKDAQQVLEIFQYLGWIEFGGTQKKWIAHQFLISYTGRRTDLVPFTLICDSKILP